MYKILLRLSILGCIFPISSQAALIDLSTATASAGNTYLPATPTYLPENAIDGDYNTSWNGGGFGGNSALTYLDIDLNALYDIGVVTPYSVGGGNTFTILTRKLDSDPWVQFGIGNGTSSFPTVSGSATARYVRYNVISGNQWAHLTEITIDGNISTVPVPAAVWLFGSGLLGLVGVARQRL